MKLSRNPLMLLVLAGLFPVGCQQGDPVSRVNPNQAALEAKVTILDAVDHPEPLVRARALEAVSRFMLDEHGMLLVSALDDPSPGVRTVAAMAIGDMRYQPGRRRLSEMVSQDRQVGEPYLQVLPAVVYGLYRLGDDRHLKMLGPLLLSDVEIIRTNTADAMGRIGDPRALGPLSETIYREEYEARLRFDAAMARLGDAAAKGRLEAYVHGRFVDLRISGIQALAAHNPGRAREVLPRLLADDKEHPAVRLTAAGELARMGAGGRKTREYALRCLRQPGQVLREAFDLKPARSVDEDLRLFVRRQAAWAVGWMGPAPRAVDELMPYMDSDDASMRVLAAMSVLRLLPEAVEAEVPDAPLPKTGAGEAGEADVMEDPLAPAVPDAPGGRLKTSGVKE
jgi:HEAT repeat protein